MNCYLVTYDLEDPDFEGDMLDYLKSFKHWKMVTESSYVVITNNPPRHIRARMVHIANKKVTVYVFKVEGSPGEGWAGFGYPSVNRWLQRLK